MEYRQIKEPNLSIVGREGWCLAYVTEVFGIPGKYPTAISGWENAQHKHTGMPPANVAVPVWFSYNGPDGHIAAWVPGKGVYSTSARGDKVFSSVEALVAWMGEGFKYLGWTEDLNGVNVVQEVAPAPPAPPAAPSHPYSVQTITPKKMTANVDRKLWNLDDTQWSQFATNPRGVLGAGAVVEIVAIATHNLGSKYYMPDPNVAAGYNIVDLVDYIPPAPAEVAQPAASAPVPPAAPTGPQIIFERLASPVAYKTNKQPTNVWGINHTSWPAIEADIVRQYNKGSSFTAVGRAKHELGGVYMMAADDFGNADTTGKPVNYDGINVVDLDGDPSVTTPPQTVADVVAPVAPVVPGTTIQPAAQPLTDAKLTADKQPPSPATDWRNSFKESVQALVSKEEVWVKDLEGILPDAKLLPGKLVAKAGVVWKDGQKFIITIQNKAEGKWYGIPETVVGPVAASQRARAQQILENIWERYHTEVEDDIDALFSEGMRFEDDVKKGAESFAADIQRLHGRDKLVDVLAKWLFHKK